MKITIESTDRMAESGGESYRVWSGLTEAGVRCEVLLRRITVGPETDPTEFARAMSEDLPLSWSFAIRDEVSPTAQAWTGHESRPEESS